MLDFFYRIIALTAIFYLFPLIIVIFILSYINQGSPCFFSQVRVGKDFKEFTFYKFRTMRNKIGGNLFTISGDNRITRFGRILRKFKIDELPQLWNVVKGDIEFVGPRAEVKEYVDEINFAFLRHIKPGITDFSSIILRNEESVLRKIGGDSCYKQLLPIKLKLIEIYAMHKNISLDIEIIFLTILSIFFPDKAQTIVLEKFINKNNYRLYTTIKSLMEL